MPVTTILQHQIEKERLVEPDSDMPMPDHDQGPSMRDYMQKVRLQWALAVEKQVHVSLLTEAEKAAAVPARWIPPDSSYSVEIVNRSLNPDSSNASTLSTSHASAGVYNGSQTGGRKFGQLQRTPPDGHNSRQLPPANRTSKLGANETQQQYSQQYSSSAHDYVHISPDVYDVTHRAVNALRAHKQGETPSENNIWQANLNSPVSEQTAPLEHNGRQAPYADHHTGHPTPGEWDAVRAYPNAPNAVVSKTKLPSSRQLLTLLARRPIAGVERMPPILDRKHRVPLRAINRSRHPAGSMPIHSQRRLFDRRIFNIP